MESPLLVLGVVLAAWAVLNAAYTRRRDFFDSRNIRLLYGLVLVYRVGNVKAAGRLWKALTILFAASYALSVAWFLIVMVEGVAGKIHGGGGLRVLVPGVDITGLDLAYFIVAVALAAVLHEFFHGKAAVGNGVGVKSFGLALAFVLPLAFTEIDEKDFAGSSRRVKIGILAAGVAANLALGLLGLVFLNTATSPTGILVTNVVPGSLASKAGVEPYSILLSLNGVELRSVDDLRSVLSNTSATSLNLTLLTPEGSTRSIIIERNTTDKTLGVYIMSPPAGWLVRMVGVYLGAQLVKAFFWLYLVNFNLAILNAAPLFITDGGRIVFELFGERFKKMALAVNTLSLAILLLALAPCLDCF